MPCEILHPMVWDTSVNSLAPILKTINLFPPCKLIFWKSYQSWEPSKFSKAHFSVVENPSVTILDHIIIRTALNILFLKITHITKKTPKLVAKILATKFGFVPDWLWFRFLVEIFLCKFPQTNNIYFDTPEYKSILELAFNWLKQFTNKMLFTHFFYETFLESALKL